MRYDDFVTLGGLQSKTSSFKYGLWMPVSIHAVCDNTDNSLDLVVIPDVGDDVVDVSHFGLLEHPLHQLLGHTLPDGEQDEDGDQGEHDENGDQDDDDDLEADWGPPVPIEGADEAKIEAVVVRQLATHCSGLQIIRFY